MDKKSKDLGIEINDQLLSKKREIFDLKKQGEAKIGPYKKKFEARVKEFVKLIRPADTHLKFYDLGHIMEAVFAEVDPYECELLGLPLKDAEAVDLLKYVENELALKEGVSLGRNKLEINAIDSIYIYARQEKEAIDKIRKAIEEEISPG